MWERWLPLTVIVLVGGCLWLFVYECVCIGVLLYQCMCVCRCEYGVCESVHVCDDFAK